METPSCPFCPFSDTDTQFIAEHIEFCHPENGTSGTGQGGHIVEQPEGAFNHQQDLFCDNDNDDVGDDDHDDDDEQDCSDKYVNCPHGCGELVTKVELPIHLDLHIAEDVANEETRSPQPERRSNQPDTRESGTSHDDYNIQDKYEFTKKGRSGQKNGASLKKSRKRGRARSPSSKASSHNAFSGSVKKLGVCSHMRT